MNSVLSVQVLLGVSVAITVLLAKEQPIDATSIAPRPGGCLAAFIDLYQGIKNMTKPMVKVVILTAENETAQVVVLL